MKLLVTSAFNVLVLSSTAMFQSQRDSMDQTASIVCNAKSNNGFCGSINYTSFAVPNFRNGTEEREIETELSSYIILYSSGCSNALVHLLCGYYKPPCYRGPNAEAIRLTPCRELCLYVRSSCEPVIKEHNAAWPDHLDCDQFPLKGDENGPICFPNFHALEDYQTRLELPSIRGAPRPPTVVAADRFWSPECPSPPPIFSGPPTVQPGVVSVNWTAAGSSDPLETGVRYALYSQCGEDTTFQLIDDDIQGLSYNITTLPSLTQCVLRVVAYSDHCLLNVNGTTTNTTDNFTTECPSSAPMFSGPPTVQPGVVSVNWTTAGSSDPLVTGIRYALYSQCGAETTFQLIDDDIQGLSYDITTLPNLTQCVLRVVVYSDQCILDVNGPAAVTTDTFTTGRGCQSLAVMFSGPSIVQPGIVSVSWTAAAFSDPLVKGVRYALYSQCGAETTFQLIDDDIQGLSYDITTLPNLTQCVLRVAAYSDHCLLDVNGATTDTTEPFTTGSQMQVSTNWSSTTTTILSIALTLAGVLTIGTCTLAVLLVVVLVTKKKMAAINTGQQPAKLEMHS